MADEFTGFTSEAFSFWKGLERHNNRDWFQAHKDQYEQAVRRPMQLLIEEPVDSHLLQAFDVSRTRPKRYPV